MSLASSYHSDSMLLINSIELQVAPFIHGRSLDPKELAFMSCLLEVCACNRENLSQHTTLVATLSVFIGMRSGMSTEKLERLYFAAQFHDIGKLVTPERLLKKTQALSAQEQRVLRNHTVLGEQMLKKHNLGTTFELAASIALTHHERYDGTGYPMGLKELDIPLESRMVAIADVFEALISSRPYKQAWLLTDALNWMAEQAGKHFDPALLALFLNACWEIHPYRMNT